MLIDNPARLSNRNRNDSNTNSVENWILTLIWKADGEIKGRTRLMKLAFLLDRYLEKRDQPSPFEFEAYKYGPFDKQVIDAVENLKEKNLIDENQVQTDEGTVYAYSLSNEGPDVARETYKALRNSQRHQLKDVLRNWSTSETGTLLGFVYNEHSNYIDPTKEVPSNI